MAVYNPHSGGGAYRRDLPLILDALRGLGYDVEERETAGRRRRHGPRARGRRAGFDLVCAIGGDGTVNETINGLAGTEVPLAIVPTGTVNVLAMELGIPLDPPDAVRLLETGNRVVDRPGAGRRPLLRAHGRRRAWTPPSSPRCSPVMKKALQGGGLRRAGARQLPDQGGSAASA